MRRSSSRPIWVIVSLVILIAIFGYFGYRLYRQDKQIESIRTAVVEDGNKINGVVNFINSSLANTGQQK